MNPSTLVGSAVTLVLGWIVAAGLFLSADDVPDSYLGDIYLPFAAVLILLAAPVGLLVAWGELDLSSFGLVPFGAYMYSQLGSSGVAVGLLAAAVLGLAFGAGLGVARWLTRTPAALLSLGAGLLVQQGVNKLVMEEGSGEDASSIDSWGLPMVVAVVVVGLAVVAGFVREQVRSQAPDTDGPGLEVAIGYALSGMGASLAGAAILGQLEGGTPVMSWPTDVFFQPSSAATWTLLVVVVLLAIAIGGIVRGGGVVAPIAATLGALAAVLLRDALAFNDWAWQDRELVIAVVIVAGLVIAHGLQRALAGTGRPRPLLPMPIPPPDNGYPVQPPQSPPPSPLLPPPPAAPTPHLPSPPPAPPPPAPEHPKPPPPATPPSTGAPEPPS